MNKLLEFQLLLQEGNYFPKDELRDYYLVPAKAFLSSNPEICTESYNDKTALMMVAEQLIIPNTHNIREIHLNLLAMEVIDKSTKEILNYQNIDGDSVIHLSTRIECFSVGILDLIKEKGGSFSLINKNGETPLIKVAGTNSLDDIKFIHSYTKPKLLDHRDLLTGSTALMHSIYKRKISNTFFLLESGASLFIRDNAGKNILEIIQDPEYKENSEKEYYKELQYFVNLFSQKQIAEQNLKKIIER